MVTLKPWDEIQMIPHLHFEVWVGTIYDDMILFDPQAHTWTQTSQKTQTYLIPLFGKTHDIIWHKEKEVIEILPNDSCRFNGNNKSIYLLKVQKYMLKEPSTGGTPEVPYPEGRPAGTGGSRLRL